MLFMIDRFAVYVIPAGETLAAGNRWTVSWRIDDIKQLNETVRRGALADVFPTAALAAQAGRRASMEQLDRLIGETVRSARQAYIEPEDDQD
ncbi:hypothetical protein IB69_018695 [Xanthomonas citri]|uniref:hypothetical protein n=1 Tax=Xanthomonas citri TaxID=346 RepID=UPI0006E4FD5E|nr:hypothetical protein [Xanthomonas citri]MBO9753849.1 hypothetical protein [Xanthomonas phaseoli pv. dieffenbachiae]OQP83182.1 hypothetical protein IB69_018695 [Xanthomonas citri]